VKDIKSAYEIAMEKAEKIDSEAEGLDKKGELKPLLAKFFKEKIDTEDLWQELNKEYEPDQYACAQEMIIDSLGLRTTDEQLKKRKEGILAIESLKEEQNSSRLEQYMNNVSKLIKNYEQEREQMEEQIKQRLQQNSQAQMRPVQTEDGRTVMKMESGVDNDTKEQFNKMISQFEEKYSDKFNQYIEELKQNL